MARFFIMRIMALVVGGGILCGNAWAHPPWGIVADRQGQVYFSDLETIWKIDARGRLSVFRAGVQGKHTHELAIDEGGNLFGEDLTYDPASQRNSVAMWRMTPAGDLSYVLAMTTSPPAGFSLWRDRAGNMYSVKQNQDSPQREVLILKRTSEGRLVTLHGGNRPPPPERQPILYSVGGVAFGPDGTLYATDGKNILKITADGGVSTLARNISAEGPAGERSEGGSGGRVYGLAVDAQGNVFAADFNNRRVVKVAPDGKTTTLLRTESPWSPSGVTISNGELYLLEFGPGPPRPRVQKLAADGKVTTLATVGEDKVAAAGQNDAAAVQSPEKSERPARTYCSVAVALGLAFVAWQLRGALLALVK